ncbi:MAG: GIY-YIG nuclease family protein [Bacteroidota bacterium]
MSYFTYILISEKDCKYYYGYTSNLSERLNRHNSGLVRSTKARIPLKIHYFEKFDSKTEAIKREIFFKSIDGYNWLRDQNIIVK